VLASGNTTSPYCRAVSINTMHMRQIFYILLITLLLTACKQAAPKLTSVEYIAYNWSVWDAETQKEVPMFLKCNIYCKIDNLGNAKMYFYRNVPAPNSYYFEAKFNQSLIRQMESIGRVVKPQLIDSLYILSVFRFFIPNSPFGGLYEGPELKVSLNYEGESPKVYSYIRDDIFRKIIPSMVILDEQIHATKIKEGNTFNDTIEFNKGRLNLIKRSASIDSCFEKDLKPSAGILINISPIRILYYNRIENSTEFH
jgi:hypothetical protein